jgi:Mor family transcriptional regulator
MTKKDELTMINMSNNQNRWPQALIDFVDVIQSALKNDGNCDPDKARQLAYVAVSSIASYRGGRIFYLPKGKQFEIGLRDKKIWDEFNGKNIKLLVSKYKLAEPHLYAILAQQRKLHAQQIQGSLL